MLSKPHRLTKKKDFEMVFERGKSTKHDFLLVRVMPNTLPHSRFGFIVSKKVSPKAVVRNKVKRRLRKAVEDALKSSTLAPVSKDVIVISLPAIIKQEFSGIQKLMGDVLKKLKIT